MNRKNLFVMAICACIFGAPLGWVAKDFVPLPTPAVVESVVVEATPRHVVLGELIELEVKGDDVAWCTAPPCEDTAVTGDGDTRLFVSFRSAGLRSVYAASSLDRKAAITRFDFNVTRSTGPEPGPEPKPTPDTIPVEDEWVTRLQSWDPGPRPEAVSEAFVEVADWSQDRLSESKLTTPSQILSRTKTAVNKAVGRDNSKWKPFFDGLADHLAGEAEDNTLVTQRDYIVLWRKIGTALGEL